MKKISVYLAGAVLAGAAAYGAFYLDERFDGPFPPQGWTWQGGTLSSWSLRTNGPWGNYAYGVARVVGTTGSTATLNSKQVPFPIGRRLYYSFRALADCVMSINPRWEFWILYAGTEEPLAYHEWRGPFYPREWRCIEGSAVVAQAVPVFARFRVSAWGNTIEGHAEFHVDTVQIADVTLTAVAPASLGRVKALFH